MQGAQPKLLRLKSVTQDSAFSFLFSFFLFSPPTPIKAEQETLGSFLVFPLMLKSGKKEKLTRNIIS